MFIVRCLLALLGLFLPLWLCLFMLIIVLVGQKLGWIEE